MAANNSDDDEPIELSAHAAAALEEFYAERSAKTSLASDQCSTVADLYIEENWQLSQFWYTCETSDTLARECRRAVGSGGSIACISCPSLFDSLLISSCDSSTTVTGVHLFEFDERFGQKYGSERFTFYDYRQPLALPADLRSAFDLVVIDPPYLATECLEKVYLTVRFVAKAEAKLIVCTGAKMEAEVKRLFSATPCTYKPQHERNLANEFCCYANYADCSLL